MESIITEMKVVRVQTIAAAATLSERRHFSVVSLHRSAIALLLLTAAVSPTTAFSPSHGSYHIGSSLLVNSDPRVVGAYHVNNVHHRVCSPLLRASEDDGNANNSIETQIDENDEEDDDDVDVITQRLRRNSENGPINPMKEVDKMVKENEDEANINGSNNTGSYNSTDSASTLYSYMLGSTVDPDFDPTVSTDEAYVESQFKQLLSRKGAELSKLGPGIATLPLDPTSEEAKSEDLLSQKEAELQQVIDEVKTAGSGEWDEFPEQAQAKQAAALEKAHKLQSEIDQLHVDDCGAVLLANLAFYEAFSLQDFETMKEVWWQSPSSMCVHPSHPPLIGSNAIYESFSNMFDNGIKGRVRRSDSDAASASGGVFMTPTNIRGLSVRGSTASLVCDEEVFSKGSGGESISRQGGLLANKLLTTNVFRKINSGWKMVHRHASWHPDTTSAQEALKAEPGIVLYDSKNDVKSNSSSKSQQVKEGMTLQKLKGDGKTKRPLGLPSVPSSLEGLDAKAVLGIPMPKEEESTKSTSSNEEGMLGKIINLSDLLGGGESSSSSPDGEEDKGIGDVLSELLGGSADSDSTSTSGSGTPEDPFISRRVIKIGPDGVEDLMKKKNKQADGDEDVEDAVIDLRGKSEEERKDILSNLVDNVLQDAGLQPQDIAKNVTDVESSVVDEKEDEDVRTKCIATLRKLSEQGLLSPAQKRLLLTDIITASARGGVSMVEVAYELLLRSVGEEPDDTAMEDFTEQCHVFASMVDEKSNQ